MLHHHALVRVNLRADMFECRRDRDEFFFERADGARVAYAAELGLDVVQPVGDADDLVAHGAGVQPLEAHFHIVPAAFHATHGILARQAVHQRAQFVEILAQSVRAGCLHTFEPLEALGEPGDVLVQVIPRSAFFGECVQGAHFVAETGDLVRQAFGNVLL